MASALPPKRLYRHVEKTPNASVIPMPELALKHPRQRIPNDAYFTRDPRPVKALFIGLPELKQIASGFFEPFCGGGHLAEDIKAQGFAVWSSDLVDYGYRDQAWQTDFFEVEAVPVGFNSICSNLMYQKRMVDRAIKHALSLLPEGGALALLLNHRFDAALTRTSLFQAPDSGFYARVVLPFRIWWFEVTEESEDPAQDHSWFVWVKGYQGDSKNIYLDPAHFSDFTTDEVRAADVYCK